VRAGGSHDSAEMLNSASGAARGNTLETDSVRKVDLVATPSTERRHGLAFTGTSGGPSLLQDEWASSLASARLASATAHKAAILFV
jgi:hypothetical protein